MPPPSLNIQPPLLNSACPWATTAEHLRALLESPSTGAITVRTSLIDGFDHQPSRHRFIFFDPSTTEPGRGGTYSFPDPERSPIAPGEYRQDGAQSRATLNTLGYSPITLQEYLVILRDLATELPHLHHKTVIISVTGGKDNIKACYDLITSHAGAIPFTLAMEVNLSCPNIPGAPPVAYDAQSLTEYLQALPEQPSIRVGIKTPPYTHAGQYQALVSALESSNAGERLSFITSTNTLGSCLVLDDACEAPALPAGGVGGMAGPPLHPLALGNVATIRRLLDERKGLAGIAIIGVGGVSNGRGYRRMRAAGASAVALATALGREGTAVFSKIEGEIGAKL
ncbi:dihydroorotate dehydrogenase [Amphichorda felina]